MTTNRKTRRQFGIATLMVAGILSLGLSAPSASAAPIKEKVDKTHLSVMFNVWHGGFSQVTYQFRHVESIELVFDPTDVSKSSVKATIETASLDSNHFYRDNFTRSETFLNVKKFPKATFESTKITKTGDKTGKMTGNLTIAGVTKEVTFDVTYNKGGKHLSGKYSIDGFTARVSFKRSDFGIKAFIPWVGDEIDMVINLEGHHPNPK